MLLFISSFPILLHFLFCSSFDYKK
ncbi:hypothetical protein ZOSMA_2G01550 [Zostera marina]|uniref:Uncharacterized protein n=1 Tax=Zostera marina TaxID=29655 RepID=A0A0K9PAQ0_ZOSMR|nr:hypothetical protein ZOSMA_2G01550 [Zostera marina]